MKPIMSVEEAREILGDNAAGMTDEQIIETINTLDLIAKDALNKAKKQIIL